MNPHEVTVMTGVSAGQINGEAQKHASFKPVQKQIKLPKIKDVEIGHISSFNEQSLSKGF